MYRVLVRDRSASSANAVRLFGTVSVAALAAMMAAPTANAQTAQQLDDIYINDGQGTVQPGSGGAGGQEQQARRREVRLVAVRAIPMPLEMT